MAEDKYVKLTEWRKDFDEKERKCEELRNSENNDDTMCVLVSRSEMGGFKSVEMTVRQLREKGIWDGKTRNPDLSERRAKGALVHCRFLDNAPKLPHFCGPMFDGLEHPLRYETEEVFNILSE